jgi:hypothetical protein
VGGVVRQRLVDALAEHPEGLNREQLMRAAYYDDPNGGASYATLRVNVYNANKELAKHGYHIRARPRGPGARYRIDRISANDDGYWQTMWAAPYPYPERL